MHFNENAIEIQENSMKFIENHSKNHEIPCNYHDKFMMLSLGGSLGLRREVPWGGSEQGLCLKGPKISPEVLWGGGPRGHLGVPRLILGKQSMFFFQTMSHSHCFWPLLGKHRPPFIVF